MARYPHLRSHRNLAGLSQAELHRKSKVSRDIISSLENGGSHSPNLAYALLNVLTDTFFCAQQAPAES